MGRGKPERYLELAEKIRQMIKDRNLKRNDLLPSERQMAAMLSANHLTLRKALRILEQERIIYKEPSKGNYVGPRPPSGKGRKLIGIVFPDHDVFFCNILAGLEERLASAGLHPLVHLTRNSRKREEETIDFAMEQELGAFIAAPNRECVEKYREMQIPLIFFDTWLEGIKAPHVVSDDEEGAAMAAKHLLSLGHKSFAYVGSAYDRSMALRLKGFSEALRQGGATLAPVNIRNGEATRQWGFKAAGELLALPQPPTALLCGNDTIAAGVLRHFAEKGVQVPGQVSVAGFGNTSVAEDLNLTSVDQHTDMVAAALWNLLRLALSGDSPPHETVIPTSLILRGSTGRTPR